MVATTKIKVVTKQLESFPSLFTYSSKSTSTKNCYLSSELAATKMPTLKWFTEVELLRC